LLQPIQISSAVLALLMLVLMFVPNVCEKYFNWLSLSLISALSLFVSAQTVWFSAILADELGLGGDSTGFMLFIGTAIITVLYLAVYYWHTTLKTPDIITNNSEKKRPALD